MGFSKRIRPHVDGELSAAAQAGRSGRPGEAFHHLERAHVLGQAATLHHVRAHLHMLAWALRHRRPREVRGQVLRTLAAAFKTVFWIPVGNTGGSDVHPLQPMPVPPDLARLIDEARGAGRP